MTTKQLNIKDRSYYFYNDIINLWNFDGRNLKIDKKLERYVNKKPEWHVSSVNQPYFIVNRVCRFISEENRTKYLTIDKPESVLKKYKEIFSNIKQKIEELVAKK